MKLKIFGRCRNDKVRKPTEDEINANLDIEGDATAKLPYVGPTPTPTPLQPPQELEKTPKWSNYTNNNNNNNNGKHHDDSNRAAITIPHGGDRGANVHANADTMEKFEDDYNLMEVDGKPVYVVKQKRGYLSILFSFSQIGILIAMMIQCGIAPMGINPMVGPYPDALNYWGGKNAYYILYDQEYWRLLTPIMLHAGVFHLLCNVAVQLDTGAFWEREWGSFVWLMVYLVSAVWGSILSVIAMPNSVGVGSSGSVCGLFGAKMAESFCRMREKQRTEQDKLSHDILCEQFGTVLCSVIMILAFSFIPYVDWAAHVGGLIGGFAIGILLFSFRVKTRTWKVIWFLTGFLMNGIGLALGVIYMHEEIAGNVAAEMADVCGYYEDYFRNMGQEYQCNCMLEQEN